MYVHTDQYTGQTSGNSPGFGLCLWAESTTGCFLAIDTCGGGAGVVPEDLGEEGSRMLLEEVRPMLQGINSLLVREKHKWQL